MTPEARLTPVPPEPVAGRRRGPEPEAFEKLFLAEYGRVVAISHRVLADRQEAEDVAQEVFLDFHCRHPADAPFAARWLHTAAVHTSLNRIRGRKRRERRELAESLERPIPADPQGVVETQEQRQLVRHALGRLSSKHAAVLALRYSGLSYAEVGSALGIGTGQIGTLLRRAEAALRKEITGGTPA